MYDKITELKHVHVLLNRRENILVFTVFAIRAKNEVSSTSNADEYVTFGNHQFTKLFQLLLLFGTNGKDSM